MEMWEILVGEDLPTAAGFRLRLRGGILLQHKQENFVSSGYTVF